MKKLLPVLVLLACSPLFGGEYEALQWGLRNTGVPVELKLTDIDRLKLPATAGEDIGLGQRQESSARKIRVAVIDSGIDLLHPEFRSKIYRNEGECRAWELYSECLAKAEGEEELVSSCHEKWAKTDTDQNGYPMDCHGWNVAAPVNAHTGVQGNNDVTDLVGHGTHIAGIIAAAQNELGVSGVINNVEILPVKVSGSTEEVKEDNSTDIFAKGIMYALKQRVDIINLSVGWSSNEDSVLVSELINKAHAQGVIVVVAGGNSAHSTETYPCAYNEVICVGSHNPDGSRSHFSNFGTSIDLYAPGHNILSTWPLEIRPKIFTARHGYEFKNGTSFSSPFVVGVLARLLNLGFSPDQARQKLLGGTRNGNLDFSRAVSIEAKSFIYPYKKSAAFMNWHEGDRKFILKLKNYISDAKGVTLQLVSNDEKIKVKDAVKRFEIWERDEIKEINFSLVGADDVPSEMNFELNITSSDESKTYATQVVATTVVHDKFSRGDTESSRVQASRDLEAFEFIPFQNISPSKETDFLLTQSVEGKVVLGLLKKIEGSYRLSKLQPTIFDKALIVQAARVDVDQDGKTEHVVIGMYQNKDKKWAAKFYVFDEGFRPYKYEVCPDNELVNLLTAMGTQVYWIKHGGRMVPAWIAQGYAPSIDLPPFNPWAARVANDFKKRIYYLDDKGLRTLSMPHLDWSLFGPVAFFPQSQEDLRQGKATFVYSLDQGFSKTYALADTKNLEARGNFVMTSYQNLYPIEPVTHANTADLIFAESDSTVGRGRLSVLSPLALTAEQRDYEYVDPLDPIQLIVGQTAQGNFFAHTKYNLLYLNQAGIAKTESHNADQQMQYKRLAGKEAVYLSSQHTPGLSSEMVVFESGKLLRPAKYRFLLGNGCQEIGYHYSPWENQDQLLFYCDNGKVVFKVKP